MRNRGDSKLQLSLSDKLYITLELATCSLDTHPGKSNWVEDNGGLPEAICAMAKDIADGGKSISSAISIAVSQAKKLAATSKDAKTRAKYAKAVAEWEALKAKAAAKRGKKVAATQESSLEKILRLTK